jgi:uncharacterized membrane protein
MDTIGIAIIVISVVLAVLFKVVVMKRIREWVDQDLIRSLSNGDSTKLDQLMALDQSLKRQETPRGERHQQLEQLAESLNSTK